MIAGEVTSCVGYSELQWEYSHNQRRYTAYDKSGDEAYWITSLAPLGSVQGKHGYVLRRPGSKVAIFISSSVNELKELANNAMLCGTETEPTTKRDAQRRPLEFDVIPHFQFGNVVVVDGDQIGVIVKSWSDGSHDVYVRSINAVAEYSETEIKHYVYSKELTDDEREFYK